MMSTFTRLSYLIAVISFMSFLVGQRNIDMYTVASNTTTVVILNWSRPFNVHMIVSEICKNIGKNLVPSITIWNNSPQQMSFEEFSNSSCLKSRLRIINSSENLYFEARYMACALANTRYCFIQDDDYLVLPEIIEALTRRMSADINAPSSIHLQPPHEMLSSVLRTVEIDSRIRTTFAWLGYGTIIKQSQAVEFLALLNQLDLSDEQHKMADNYFTILSNDLVERWFDSGIPLSGGQPFTVGPEGEERNNHHIIEAAKILEFLTLDTERNSSKQKPPYMQLPSHHSPVWNISRAPCHGRICIFGTSIQLLPNNIFDVSVTSTRHILKLEQERLVHLGESWVANYIDFPPSNTVDGEPKTVFCSPQNGKRDEWIMLDLTQRHFYNELQLVLEVDESMKCILQTSVYETSEDGLHWAAQKQQISCTHIKENADDFSLALFGLLRCTYFASHLRLRYLRVRLLENVDCKWRIFEMYVIPA